METTENTLPADLADRVAIATGDAPQASTTTDNTDTAPDTGEAWPVSPMGAHIADKAVSALAGIATGWAITEKEQEMLRDPLAAIVTAWLPEDMTAPPNPYVALLLAAALIAGPRVATGQPLRLQPPEPSRRPDPANVSHPQAWGGES